MSAATDSLRMVLAGGGTGGHLYPAVAVARELRDRLPDSEVLFVNAGRPLEREVLARQGFAAQAAMHCSTDRPGGHPRRRLARHLHQLNQANTKVGFVGKFG